MKSLGPEGTYKERETEACQRVSNLIVDEDNPVCGQVELALLVFAVEGSLALTRATRRRQRHLDAIAKGQDAEIQNENKGIVA